VNQQSTNCKVCGSRANVFDVVDFNKFCAREFYGFGLSGIFVLYLRCQVCGFMFTQFFDDWSPEEFARFIYNEDYIRVDGEYADSRPKRDAAAMALRLAEFTGLNILDYGSGTGRFAEYLAAAGIGKVSSYDPFTSPTRPDDRFDLITCFEVVEHSTAPAATLADIASLLDPGGCIIFSTGIQPPDIAEIRSNWWYVAPRNGHASIYTHEALALAGQAAGIILYAGPGGTAFAGTNPSPTSQQILASVGRPVKFWHLTAPDGGGAFPVEQGQCWHGVEGTGSTSFRWTREPEIVWRLQEERLPPCQLSITIPFQNEISEDFADNCLLEIGNKLFSLVRNGGALGASLAIEEAVDATVKLITPAPLRPSDLRDVTDNRPLGIAISTRSAFRSGTL
jgi:2-polyprenyl-6-hydroxyphenyl methylase/3-demethylubiquinone-9 3-methyltransferase